MLRVTVQSETDQKVIRVEGKLAGPAVAELEDCWSKSSAEGRLVIDIRSVTFASEDGRNLLARMYRAGAKLVSAGTMMNAIVEQIASGGSKQQS